MKRLVVLGFLLAAPAAMADVQFSGYIKTFAIDQQAIRSPYLNAPHLYQSQSSLRLMWQAITPSSAWQLHYELTPILSSTTPAYELGAVSGTNSWRLTDIQRKLSNNPRRQWLQNLDRLNVQFKFNAGDLTVGRQAVSFGVSRVINPTDIFLPFDVRTLNTEYRIGVDAVRFQHPVGQLSEVDVGFIAGKNARADDSAGFLQVRTNVSGNDLQFAFIRFAGQTLVGGGVQTAIGNAGFWFEAGNVTGDRHYLRASTGVDYAFTESLYGLVEYHFNGAGTSNLAEYPAQLATTPYRVGGVFLLGRQYLIPSLRLQASPLLTVSGQAMVNLEDGSVFAAVTSDYNLSENTYLGLGYYHFIGPGLSEYGSNPDTFYASLRYYF